MLTTVISAAPEVKCLQKLALDILKTVGLIGVNVDLPPFQPVQKDERSRHSSTSLVNDVEFNQLPTARSLEGIPLPLADGLGHEIHRRSPSQSREEGHQCVECDVQRELGERAAIIGIENGNDGDERSETQEAGKDFRPPYNPGRRAFRDCWGWCQHWRRPR